MLLLHIENSTVHRIGRIENMGKVFVFLDEINTSKHVGLLTEIITEHSIHGKPINENIRIVAAMNPYRLKPKIMVNGLVPSNILNNVESTDPFKLDTANLQPVYKVYPIPEKLFCFIYDFGSLEEATERMYIESMIKRQIKSMKAETGIKWFVDVLLVAQKFLRISEKDLSAVSLRDIKRICQLVNWFEANPHNKDLEGRSQILALAIVYHYRLPSRSLRTEFWKSVCAVPYVYVLVPYTVIDKEEQLFCAHAKLDDDIASNEALRENLFVSITCIANKIPIFLVGKPGTSKTLTLQVIQENLRGKSSPDPFWRTFPSVTIISFQCSKFSTAAAIESQYQKALQFQGSQGISSRQAGQEISQFMTVLVLDEIGLAEHSPDNPLKVLHKMLPEEKIAIVGISNWILDPAKMNRSILLNRTDATPKDLEETGKTITQKHTSGAGLDLHLGAIAEAYVKISLRQNFFGMRDYYSLLKFIHRSKVTFNEALLINGLRRNFGGKRDENVISIFRKSINKDHRIGVKNLIERRGFNTDMIKDNLNDPQSRHLMVITRNQAALSLMIGFGLIDPLIYEILIGSKFSDDVDDYDGLSLVVTVNKIKDCMASGRRVILINQDSIYEALYDVLNQRTIRKTLKSGQTQRMLRLAIGANSQLCPVDPNFKLIVIVEEKEAYEILDVPLLSRFEKQTLTSLDVVADYASFEDTTVKISSWVESLVRTGKNITIADIMPGYTDCTFASFVLTNSSFNEKFWPEDPTPEIEFILNKMFVSLIKCMSPVAVCTNSSLLKLCPDYFEDHASLAKLINTSLQKERDQHDNMLLTSQDISLWCLRTWTPAHTLSNMFPEIAHTLSNMFPEIFSKDFNSIFIHPLLCLSLYKSERELHNTLSKIFFSQEVTSPSILIIQCDARINDSSIIYHLQFILEKLRQQRLLWSPEDVDLGFLAKLTTEYQHEFSENSRRVPIIPLHIFVIIHDPPTQYDISMTNEIGKTNRQKQRHCLDFRPLWRHAFCDDIRPEVMNVENLDFVLHIRDLLNKSTIDLARNNEIFVKNCMRENYRNAISLIAIPTLMKESYSKHLKIIHDLLTDDIDFQTHFLTIAVQGVLLVLDNLKLTEATDHRSKVRRMHGSYRQCLSIAFEEQIISAFARLLAILDRNFNLYLAKTLKNIWFSMIRDHSCSELRWSQSAITYLTSSNQALKVNRHGMFEIINDGRHESMICEWPFSSWFIQRISNSDYINEVIKIACESQQVGQHFEQAATLLRNKFSVTYGISASVKDNDNYMDADFDNVNYMEAYFHDVVAMKVPIFTEATDVEFNYVLMLYRKVLISCYPAVLSAGNPYALHIVLNYCDSILFALMGIMRVTKTFSDKDILYTLFINQIFLDAPESEQMSAPFPVYIFIAKIFNVIVQSMLSKWHKDNSYNLLHQQLKPFLDIIYAIICAENEKNTQFQETIHLKQVLAFALMLRRPMVKEQRSISSGYIETLINRALDPHFGGLSRKDNLRFIFSMLFDQFDALEAGNFIRQILLDIVGITTKQPKEMIDFFICIVCTNIDESFNFPKEKSVLLDKTVTCLKRSIIAFLMDQKFTREALLSNITDIVRNTNPPATVSIFIIDAIQIIFQWVSDMWPDAEPKGICETAVSLNEPILDSIREKGITPTMHVFCTTRQTLIDYLKKFVAASDPIILEEIPLAIRQSWTSMFVMRSFIMKQGLASLIKLLDLPPLIIPWWVSIDFLNQMVAGKNIPEYDLFQLEPLYKKLLHEKKRLGQIFTPELLVPTERHSPLEVKSVLLLMVVKECIDEYVQFNHKGKQPSSLEKLQHWLTEFFYPFSTEVNKIVDTKLEWGLFSLFLNPAIQANPTEPDERRANGDSQLFRLHLSQSTSSINISRIQVAVHVASVAMLAPSGWLYSLICRPEELKACFLPSMCHDELHALIKVLNTEDSNLPLDGDVKLTNVYKNGVRMHYTCKCGYMYFIGNCGKAFATGTCPQCKRAIGKLDTGNENDHILVKDSKLSAEINIDDNTKLDDNTKPGYLANFVQGEENARVDRPFAFLAVTVRCIRLIIHAALFMSASAAQHCADSKKRIISLHSFIWPSRMPAVANIDDIIRWCSGCFLEDWNCFAKLAGNLNDENVAILIHAILEKAACKLLFAEPCASLNTKEKRTIWETGFQTMTSTLINSTLLTSLSNFKLQVDTRSPLTAASTDKVFFPAGGQSRQSLELVNFLAELHEEASSTLSLDSRLWQCRSKISFKDFSQKFYLVAKNQIDYKLIHLVLEHEAVLLGVDAIVAIFEWHSLLFEVFKDGELSRIEAMTLTNESVITRLPPARRVYGRYVLDEYIKGFNRSFVHLGRIECRENIWLKEGLVMQPQTPLIFSLPSQPFPGQDPSEGICTVALTTLLIEKHNQAIDTFDITSNVTVSSNQPEKITIVSQAISPILLRELVCSYKRSTLLQLIFHFAIQDLGVGTGQILNYDYQSISAMLNNMVFSGKRKIGINLRLYQFSGEISQSGIMPKFAMAIKQDAVLPYGMETKLNAELALVYNKVELLRLLDTTVRFLATAVLDVDRSNQALNRSKQSITSFITEDLLVEMARWEAISPSTLRSGLIQLQHLQKIYQLVELSMGIVLFGDVDTRYQVSLPSDIKETLITVHKSKLLDVKMLQPLVKTFITNHISSNNSLNEKEKLMASFGYDEDLDFGIVKGYPENYLSSLKLEHVFDLYTLLTELLKTTA